MTATVNFEQVSANSEKREVDRARHAEVALVRPGGEGWDEATALEAQTFMRRKYVQSPEELAAEYKAYESETNMITVKAGQANPGRISSCARMIEHNPNVGFKTIDDALDEEKSLEISQQGWEKLELIDHTDMIEIGTVSARDGAGPELYGAIIGYALDTEKPRHFAIASLDELVFTRLVRPLFGDGVKALGPAVDYMGSKTVPVLIDIERGWDLAITNTQFPEASAKVAAGRMGLANGYRS